MNLKIQFLSLTYVGIILYMCVMLFPALQAFTSIFNLLVILSMGSFVIGVIKKRTICSYTIWIFLLITILDYFVYATQWQGTTSFINKMLMLYEFWFPVIFGMEIYCNKRQYDHSNLRKVFYIFLIAYSFTCLTTIWGNMNYEIPSRWLATSDLDNGVAIKYRMENIGGFGFCYLTLFVTPLLLKMIVKKRNKLLYIPLVLSYGCAVSSQYFILILLLGLITIFILFEKLNKTARLLITTTTFVIVAGVILNINTIFEILIDLTQNYGVIQTRLQELGFAIMFGYIGTSSDMGERQDLYSKSIDLFNENPVLGGGFNSSVGGHSELLDLLGSMGVFGLVMLSIILYSIYQGLKKCEILSEDINRKTLSLTFWTIFILSCTNPILSSRELGLVLFIDLLFISYPIKR